MNDRILIDKENHIATVTLNRADKRNALDMAMFEAMIDVTSSLAADPDVRVVILHGDGEHFCAGIDISVFQANGDTAALADLLKPMDRSGANFFQNACIAWRQLPVPVIAALQGTVFGAGLQVAMGADLRYAGPDVCMSIMEIKWGLIPDMAITNTLPGTVAADRARELAYTGRVIPATDALNAGLVTDVVDDPLQHARTVAGEIAGRSPDAIRAIKKLFNESWRDDLVAGLHREAALQAAVMAGENQSEAVRANIERREPIFRDPGN